MSQIVWIVFVFGGSGGGEEDPRLPAGILVAYAVVFFALGVWRFRFE